MNVLIENQTMLDIANSIREKTGDTNLLLPSDMPQAISNISTGSNFTNFYNEGAIPIFNAVCESYKQGHSTDYKWLAFVEYDTQLVGLYFAQNIGVGCELYNCYFDDNTKKFRYESPTILFRNDNGGAYYVCENITNNRPNLSYTGSMSSDVHYITANNYPNDLRISTNITNKLNEIGNLELSDTTFKKVPYVVDNIDFKDVIELTTQTENVFIRYSSGSGESVKELSITCMSEPPKVDSSDSNKLNYNRTPWRTLSPYTSNIDYKKLKWTTTSYSFEGNNWTKESDSIWENEFPIRTCDILNSDGSILLKKNFNIEDIATVITS